MKACKSKAKSKTTRRRVRYAAGGSVEEWNAGVGVPDPTMYRSDARNMANVQQYIGEQGGMPQQGKPTAADVLGKFQAGQSAGQAPVVVPAGQAPSGVPPGGQPSSIGMQEPPDQGPAPPPPPQEDETLVQARPSPITLTKAPSSSIDLSQPLSGLSEGVSGIGGLSLGGLSSGTIGQDPMMPGSYNRGGTVGMQSGGTVQDYRQGGPVSGGPPGIDTVNARLNNGEYVLPPPTAQAMGGKPALDQAVVATTGKPPVGYEKGGQVSGWSAMANRGKQIEDAVSQAVGAPQTKMAPQAPAQTPADPPPISPNDPRKRGFWGMLTGQAPKYAAGGLVEYGPWSRVPDIEKAVQERRQRAVYGQTGPQVPRVSDTEMSARPAPNTRMSAAATNPNMPKPIPRVPAVGLSADAGIAQNTGTMSTDFGRPKGQVWPHASQPPADAMPAKSEITAAQNFAGPGRAVGQSPLIDVSGVGTAVTPASNVSAPAASPVAPELPVAETNGVQARRGANSVSGPIESAGQAVTDAVRNMNMTKVARQIPEEVKSAYQKEGAGGAFGEAIRGGLALFPAAYEDVASGLSGIIGGVTKGPVEVLEKVATGKIQPPATAKAPAKAPAKAVAEPSKTTIPVSPPANWNAVAIQGGQGPVRESGGKQTAAQAAENNAVFSDSVKSLRPGMNVIDAGGTKVYATKVAPEQQGEYGKAAFSSIGPAAATPAGFDQIKAKGPLGGSPFGTPQSNLAAGQLNVMDYLKQAGADAQAGRRAEMASPQVASPSSIGQIPDTAREYLGMQPKVAPPFDKDRADAVYKYDALQSGRDIASQNRQMTSEQARIEREDKILPTLNAMLKGQEDIGGVSMSVEDKSNAAIAAQSLMSRYGMSLTEAIGMSLAQIDKRNRIKAELKATGDYEGKDGEERLLAVLKEKMAT